MAVTHAIAVDDGRPGQGFLVSPLPGPVRLGESLALDFKTAAVTLSK